MQRKSSREPWITWIVSQPQFRYCVEIPSAFLADSFNLYGLSKHIKNYDIAVQIVRGMAVDEDDIPRGWPQNATAQAVKLFGLIHQRFIVTRQGLQRMHEKFTTGVFERCPRVLCGGTRCLPYGPSENFGESNTVLFCPNCGDVYETSNDLGNIDGAFFGPSWVHLFTREFPDVVPSNPPAKYVPRIFGMKVCHDESV